jgi:hypothetical protein
VSKSSVRKGVCDDKIVCKGIALGHVFRSYDLLWRVSGKVGVILKWRRSNVMNEESPGGVMHVKLWV